MRARLLALALLVAGCGHPAAPPPAPVTPPPPRVAPLPDAALVLVRSPETEVEGDAPVVAVDVAATLEERRRGLGGRETLADGTGMLFVYPDARRRTFWMKDCLVALDIAFLDADGRILQIATLPPGAGLTGNDVPAAVCEAPVRYVLEVRARWFGENGIAPADRVDVTHAAAGVRPE